MTIPTYLEPASGIVTSEAEGTDTSTSGAISIVAGVTGENIRLYRMILTCLTADTITVAFTSGNVLPPIYMGANSVLIIDWMKYRKFPSASGDSLTITKATNTTSLGYYFQYSQETGI